MDANLVQQIYPYLDHAKKTIPNLPFKDQESLMADLYLGIAGYSNKEIPKYLGRLQRLEDLKKKGKEQKFLDNIQKQQDSIMSESKEKQQNLLSDIYNKWVDQLEIVNE